MNERMVAVVGRTGYGKSSIVRHLVESHDRVMVLEQKPEKIQDWAGQDIEWYRTWPEFYGEMRAVRPRRFRVGFVPGLNHLVDCIRLAWALGDILLVIEEAGKYFPYNKQVRPHHMKVTWGGNMNVPGEVLEMCERGRHAGRGDGNMPLRCVITSQRPKRLPLCIQAELDRVYAFRLRLAVDRKWLAECPGADAELAEETKELPKFHYLNIAEEGECLRGITCP